MGMKLLAALILRRTNSLFTMNPAPSASMIACVQKKAAFIDSVLFQSEVLSELQPSGNMADLQYLQYTLAV